MKILFVQYVWSHSGSSFSGRMLVEGMRAAGHEVELASAADLLGDAELAGKVIAHGQWLAGGRGWRHWRRWGRDMASAVRLRRQMAKARPELVYVNNLTGFAAALAAKVLGVPVVWHVRELFKDAGGEMHDPPGGRRIVRWALSHLADHVVVISESVRVNVLGEGERERVSVIPNAVEDRFFDFPMAREEARRRLGLPEGGLIIGVPGTLRPVKGHSFFLKAAARLARKREDLHFAICGDGEPRFKADLIEQAARLGLRPQVTFTGTVADMREFYRACDIACISSRSESFGRTAIEAFAIGTPVAATAVGGLAETIEHERNGLLADYGDEEGLAAALQRLAADRALRENLAREGLADARAHYRQDVYVKRVLEVADMVMERKSVHRLGSPNAA